MSRRQLLPLDNADAIAWAKDYFTTLRTQRDPWIGVHWLSKEGSRRAWCDVFKALAIADPMNMIATVDLAEGGWDLADQALREIWAGMLERQQLAHAPLSLQRYMQRDALRKRTRFPSHTQKANSWLRYLAIANAVETIVARWNLPATGRKGSACAVVSLTYGRGAPTARGVQSIWEEYAPWLARMQKLSTHLQSFTEKKLTA
jgi:hypothetical protein